MSSGRVPTFSVRVTGVGDRYTALDLTERALAFSFEDNIKLADKCQIHLDNWDLSLFDDERFRLESQVEVSWGYLGRMTEPRRLKISSLKGGKVLEIEATSIVTDLHKKARGRHFENLTRAEVVAKIAGEYGLDALVADTQTKYPSITQPATMTDAQFIARLAEKEHFEFFVDKAGLHFHPGAYQGRPVAELVYYTAEDETAGILEIHYEENPKKKKGAITRRGRDPVTKKPVEGKASNDETKRPTLAPVTSVNAEPIDQPSGTTTHTATEATGPTTETTGAKRAADAEFLAHQHEAVRVRLRTIGDPRLLARRTVKVAGISKRLSGLYYVEKVTHRIDGKSYVCDVEGLRDGHNGFGSHADVKAKGTLNKQEPPKDETQEALSSDSGATSYRTVKAGGGG